MPSVMTWTHPLFDLIATEHNYFLLFETPPEINEEPLMLECKEVLEAGDEFHMAGTAGAAFNPGFRLTEGALVYLGRTQVQLPSMNHDSEMLLFDWINGAGQRPLPGMALEEERAVGYVAFTLINGTEWHFTSRSCSARVIKTNELRRGRA